MDIYEVFKNRRSIRRYKNEPVSDESLLKIANAVAVAPSACNFQPCKILAVKSPEIRKVISTICPQNMLAQAPVILVALGNKEEAWSRMDSGRTVVEIDMAIMLQQAILAATAEGLGTCWICAFDEQKMTQALNIKSPWSVLALTPLGYADASPRELERKSIDEVFEII